MSLVETAPATSRRERKKNATREAIHEAALSLAEEVGLAAVTVETITERADVAPRTFFNHFPSKVHAVLGKDPDRAAQAREALSERPADEVPLVALRHVLDELFLPEATSVEQLLRRFRLIRSEPNLLSTMHAEFEHTEREMAAAIGERIGTLPETDVYPSLVVSMAVNAMRVAIMNWCERGGRTPLESAVNDAFDHLANGLVPPSTESTPL